MRGMVHCESTFSLPLDKPLIDVGGGVGAIAKLLLAEYPTLKVVTQDIAPVVEEATIDASHDNQRFLKEGRLSFEVHDFFTNQPETWNGCTFFLSIILHNYPDGKAFEILKCLRRTNPGKILLAKRLLGSFYPVEASSPEGEARIYNHIRVSASGSVVINGHGLVIPPRSKSIPGMYDMIMGNPFGSKERGLQAWKDLLSEGGFKLSGVFPFRASGGQCVFEAVVE